ncbi:hypothetical protein FOA52_007118 [Chlamydomonas sp. UWO 241]|nr:hypothetical protein FOA52_007118 [Chlamydomonas sp. UWO 241]
MPPCGSACARAIDSGSGGGSGSGSGSGGVCKSCRVCSLPRSSLPRRLVLAPALGRDHLGGRPHG